MAFTASGDLNAAAGWHTLGLFILAPIFLLLPGCDKPEERIVPLPKESSAQATTAPSELARTSPPEVSLPASPVAKNAGSGPVFSTSVPEQVASPPVLKGGYYVVKHFSVVTNSGVQGFSPGKYVTLVRESGDDFVVTDGTILATAPRSYFTNDTTIASGLLKKQEPKSAAVPAQGNERAAAFEKTKNALALKAAQRAEEHKQTLFELKKQQMAADVANLTQRIAAAEQEISQKKSTQRPVRRTYDAWGNLISYQGRSTYTLSPDASSIRQLTEQRDRLQRELADLK